MLYGAWARYLTVFMGFLRYYPFLLQFIKNISAPNKTKFHITTSNKLVGILIKKNEESGEI